MHLPLLEHRRPELETCATCPKLSRAVCPVSNADGHETTTPWGKMTAAYLLSRGGVEATAAQAWPPWACTGCFACRHACELDVDVAGTLLDARADLSRAGLAPEPAKRVIARHRERTADADRGLDQAIERARARGAVIERGAPTCVLVGCLASRQGPESNGDDPAADVLVAVSALVAGPIDVVRGCCGGPLRAAGDRDGFAEAARAMAAATASAETWIVADAGCAHTIRVRWPEVSVHARGQVLHLVELAARERSRLRVSSELASGPVRYHDACHLGRGLGLYEPPRAVLTSILGRAPDEFARNREGATCSGGGGGVPVTAPGTARAIAEERCRQHRDQGGGVIVTTCGSSRKLLARDGTRVFDLATLIARSIGRE